MFFAIPLNHAFSSSEDGVYLHSRADSRLFNLSRLRAKTKIRKVLIRDILLANNAALVSHHEQGLQRLMDRFPDSWDLFGLTVSQRKTQIMGQPTPEPPHITMKGDELEVVHQFQGLGFTASDTLSLEVQINKHIDKASFTLSKLTKRVQPSYHSHQNDRL